MSEKAQKFELAEADSPKDDPIAHPSHYRLFPDLEVVGAIRKMLTLREYRGYLKGNILKYRLRAGKKGAPEKALEDIRKSMQYEEFLNELEAETPDND